jgi:PPK2 family polyphosphate:nucleotide phosphotransferase
MRSLLNAAAGFSLSSIDTGSTPGFSGGKHDGHDALAAGAAELSDLQEKLFASAVHGGTASVLLVVQAMDTAGKGGIVRHVLGQVNPQGVQAFSFKAPTEEEKQHDFLWRITKRLPTAGHIGVFDRSHYEDVLIHRVRGLSTPDVIEERYGLINEFEAEVVAAGTTIVKVMLHISADEQKERLGERLADPDKHWKYNPTDVDERRYWPAYMEAYQIAIERTSTPIAPWYVVPADHKWFARLAVQGLLLDALRGLDLAWPPADFDVAIEKVRLAES